MRLRVLVLVVLFALPAGASPAAAQGDPAARIPTSSPEAVESGPNTPGRGTLEAVVNARAIQTIAAGSRVDVRVREDSELNNRLRDVAVAEVRSAGYLIDTATPVVVLTLHAQHVTFGGRRPEAVGTLDYGSDLGRPFAQEGGPARPGVESRLRLWSSTRNSVLRQEGPRPPSGNSIEVELDAYDEENGWHAWRGTVTAENTWDDVFAIAREMVPPLVRALGQNVENQVHYVD